MAVKAETLLAPARTARQYGGGGQYLLAAFRRNPDMNFKTGRSAITVEIGKKLRFYYDSYVIRIPIPKSYRPRPISFLINLSAFAKLVKEGTFIGYENPKATGKSQGRLYLSDQRGEHAICSK